MNENKTHIARKLFKSFLWLLLSLTILVIGLRLSLKTKIIHDFAKSKIEQIAKEKLTVDFKISELKGDLWKEIQLTGVQLGKVDTLAYIDSIYASYDIMSLLSTTFNIYEIRINDGLVNILESEQQQDSTLSFSIQQVVKNDTSKTESSFKFNIENINTRKINVLVYSPSTLPDSVIKLNDIAINAGLSFTDEIEASLSDLSFNIKEGRLPEVIQVKASALYADEVITLEDLILNTGRSFIQANAFVNLKDSVLNSNIDLKSLVTADLQPYLDQEIPSEEVTVSINVKGDLDNLEIQLSANSKYAKDIEAVANVSFTNNPTLTRFGLKGTSLNIAALTQDSVDAYTGVFQITLDGQLNSEYENADITWGFTVEGLRYGAYTFRRFFGSGILDSGKLTANIDITTSGEERLTTNSTINDVFSKDTYWKLGYVVENFNAKYWDEDSPDTDINLNGFVEGKGFELSEKPWNYRISNSLMSTKIPVEIKKLEEQTKAKFISPIMIGSQSISFITAEGEISKDSLTMEGFTDIIDSRIEFNALMSGLLSELPSFKYNVSSKKFNANELDLIEDFPTSINMEISGKGSGSSMDDLKLEGFAHIDTSMVNGAAIDLLDAKYEISEGILVISEAEFRSEIANADFYGRRNIRDQTDPDNILSLDAEFKNTQPLAPLAQLEILQIKGTLSADINENEAGFLQCIATFNLTDVIADELFLAEKVDGNGQVIIKEKDEGIFDLEITQPQIMGTAFQDIRVTTQSFKALDSLSGKYTFEIADKDNGKIMNAGEYKLDLSSMNVDVVMNKLDLITSDNRLSLQDNFNISYKNSSVKTDSLILISPDGAFLSLAVPYADSLNQQIWLVGENFDFGVLQEIVLGEKFVDGVLFGKLDIDRTDDEVTGFGNLEIQNVEYEGVQVDIFSLNFDAANKRISSNLAMIWEKEKVISGSLDIPFDLGDTNELSDIFYDQKVSGSLTVIPTSLDRFSDILEKFEVTGTKGIVSFDGSLSGTAGSPNFEGFLNIEDPVLSEIPLDSVTANFGYNADKEYIFINTEVLAANQKAADIDIELPFSYNFKTFEVNLLGEEKPVSATITTKDFNLSVFNDFLDKEFTKNLKGTLNGELILKGTENSLSSNGYFVLTKSSLEIPIGGITLSDIESRVEFTNSKIILKKLIAKSGKGEFRANGDINLDGLTPTTLDIQARANQFKLANTDEYNMVVDINSRLQGPVSTPKSTGRFIIKNGFVVLDNFGDKAVEEVFLEGEEKNGFSLYDSLAVEMEFAIERNFFVRNRRYLDLEIEISGQLEAQKETKGELFLFGNLSGNGGYLRPLGKRFELEEAQLLFSGPAGNPDLKVKSAYIPSSYKGEQEVTVYYIINGTAENPEFSFESTPTMEKQDIVCFTLFNRPCYALESWQSALTQSGGSSPTDLLAGVLLDEVEALATRELGVDVVQIDNTRVGNETGTSIKTGWYLNERTFFAIVNEITSSDPRTLFILEYALSKTWDLIITEGEDSNRRGIDFRWQYDY